MNDLVLLKVTNGGSMLDHSPMGSWPLFSKTGDVRAVYLILGDRQIKLRSARCYNKRGGINNAEMGSWINAQYGNSRGLTLLFIAELDESDNSISYKLIGKVEPVKQLRKLLTNPASGEIEIMK